MTVEQFAEVTTHRIPTAPEFVAFAHGQRWKFVVANGSAGLVVPDRTDPLALAYAKMLSREPYRTSVLSHLAAIGAAVVSPPAAPPREAETPAAPDPEPESCCGTCVTCSATEAKPVCPKCQRPTDEKRRCWHCSDRACATCGRLTGSAFLSLCQPCGLKDQ